MAKSEAKASGRLKSAPLVFLHYSTGMSCSLNIFVLFPLHLKKKINPHRKIRLLTEHSLHNKHMRFLITLALHAITICQAAETLNLAEKRFKESMTNVTLSGLFTEDGIAEMSEDRYVIEGVTKGKDDQWKFDARIEYNKKEIKFALPAEVKWAGDTPVVTINNFPIPGAGTFQARILFFNGSYAGTWVGKKRGGKMFGNVVKN